MHPFHALYTHSFSDAVHLSPLEVGVFSRRGGRIIVSAEEFPPAADDGALIADGTLTHSIIISL